MGLMVWDKLIFFIFPRSFSFPQEINGMKVKESLAEWTNNNTAIFPASFNLNKLQSLNNQIVQREKRIILRMEKIPTDVEKRNEIVFFDVETTVPVVIRKRFWVLEFGAILVCPQKLVEIESYSTLIKPGDLSAVSERSARSNGITRQSVASAPTFKQVADHIYDILNGELG